MAESGSHENNGDVKTDCFTKRTKNTDVTFVVENKEVYASKAVLCISSPVFDVMFENNETKTVELPGSKAEHFKQFLKCIYPDTLDEINEETVYWVLPFAHKYKVKNLRGKCIKMILEIVKRRYDKKAEELYRHIKLSELYELPEVEKLCIDMASDCTLTEIEEANRAYPISGDTDLSIMKLGHRKLELAKKDAEACLAYVQKQDLVSRIQEFLNPHMYLDVDLDIFENHFVKEEKAKNYMQATRLVHQHFNENKKLKMDAFSKLSSVDQLTEEDLELFKLLPCDLKLEYETFKQSL